MNFAYMDFTRIAARLASVRKRLCRITVSSSSFDFTELSNQNTLEKMVEYCVKSGLNHLGDGSSRVVFEVYPDRVIK